MFLLPLQPLRRRLLTSYHLLLTTYQLPITPCHLLPTTYYLLLNTYHLPLTTYYLLLTTYHSLLTTYYLPLTPYHLPLATCHLLLTTYYLLLTTSYFLLTTYYLLLTTYYLLLTTYYWNRAVRHAGLAVRDAKRLFEMQFFASRAATPACRPATFHRFGRPPNYSQTLHARARFSARMQGRSTRERDFPRECEDATRKSTIFRENARTLHARARPCTSDHLFHRSGYHFTIFQTQPSARFRDKMPGRSARERDFQRECEDAPRESAILSITQKFLHREPPALYVRLPFTPVGLFYSCTIVRISGRQPKTSAARRASSFLHLGPPILHVGSRFCMSDQRLPFLLHTSYILLTTYYLLLTTYYLILTT